jgi:hypothetical protein
MIAPNPGEELKPLAGIASGGELSRVVLALKAILAETGAVETIVFDEVDAGIGGVTAEVVGRKLYELARHHQIICITHLPQIAKFGERHFSITKQVNAGRTRTAIQPLSKKDRYREIARMLGGEKITRTTLDHARELLEKWLAKTCIPIVCLNLIKPPISICDMDSRLIRRDKKNAKEMSITQRWVLIFFIAGLSLTTGCVSTGQKTAESIVNCT